MSGIEPHPAIVSQLKDEEKYPITQIVIDDEYGPLGGGGTRAFAMAVLGLGVDMKSHYKLLKDIRLWRTGCSDTGVQCIAEILQCGGSEIKIEFLEMIDNNIGEVGCFALGRALSHGKNRSLLTLKLDYNHQIGTNGIRMLCNGLRTNSTLRQLHLSFCKIQGDSGKNIGEVLSYTDSRLSVLSLRGNQLGGTGIILLSEGLAKNKSLSELDVSDNCIGSTESDVSAMEVFGQAICACTTLTSVNLVYNRIGLDGGKMLLPAVNSPTTKLKVFLVDVSLPMEIFEALHRRVTKTKKGKKR